MPEDLNDVARWRSLAAEALSLAAQMSDPASCGTLLAAHSFMCGGRWRYSASPYRCCCSRVPWVLAMATVNMERFLALRVVLLRIRLLIIRSLLRSVIALRYFIRRRRERIAPAIRPASTRVDPWMSGPIGHRQRRLLPLLLVGAACVVTGLLMGSRYDRGNWVRSPTADAVVKNVAVKPGDAGEEPNLELKGLGSVDTVAGALLVVSHSLAAR